MDQLLTNLWSRGGWFRAFTPPSAVDVAPSQQEQPRGTPILEAPSDVLLLIGDYLDAPELLSLKLACRSTYALFPQTFKTMRPNQKKLFLPLIERDPLGRGTFFCHPCNKLHPFQETSGPHSEMEDAGKKKAAKCTSRDRFSPVGNPFGLTYAHARMAMNRHLYGPEHGVPLANLCVEHSEQRDVATVHCSTSAKIMDNELFLQRTYAFTVADADVPEFRRCTGARDFKLCEHMSFFAGSSAFRQYIPELQKKSLIGGDGLVPCREAAGSCGLCLMDYDITIEPCAGESWKVVIRAIHQLGSCRSPDDWKWARFTEACRPHLFFPNRPNRRGSAYNPGTVQKRWADDETEACAVLDGGSRRGLFSLPFLS
ncbi:hypothetical protein TARUN_10388 [Trichoderma arundinaceum]|uniref:F-box domain-containing protein n=1 Tax=Trichoderma arundinaceum TaxID=490622 RepID=A0A395N7L4_TRIAR|nr:hypothetical protein TARUN_10388 [Trichoderma arundinaceum]